MKAKATKIHLLTSESPLMKWNVNRTANCGADVPNAVAVLMFDGDVIYPGRWLEEFRKHIRSCKECEISGRYIYGICAGQEAMSSEEAQ